MNAKDVIKHNLSIAKMICDAYLSDLTNDELMHRPHAGCNHLNWQVGHLINSDYSILNSAKPGCLPDLPEGFAEKYSKETATSDDSTKFSTKDELMGLAETQRSAIETALESLSDADLDQATPESLQMIAPNLGGAFAMVGLHWLMHAGQWVIVRRELGKEIKI